MITKKERLYLRWQLAKLRGSYIDLPGILGTDKYSLSKWWRGPDTSKITERKVEEALKSAPSLE